MAKEAIVFCLSYFFSICLEKLNTTKDYLSQDLQFSGSDSNSGPHKYEGTVGLLTTTLQPSL